MNTSHALQSEPLLFKEAETSTELAQIHALNHRVFGEEIAQHHMHPSGLLVDRFHDEAVSGGSGVPGGAFYSNFSGVIGNDRTRFPVAL